VPYCYYKLVTNVNRAVKWNVLSYPWYTTALRQSAFRARTTQFIIFRCDPMKSMSIHVALSCYWETDCPIFCYTGQPCTLWLPCCSEFQVQWYIMYLITPSTLLLYLFQCQCYDMMWSCFATPLKCCKCSEPFEWRQNWYTRLALYLKRMEPLSVDSHGHLINI
jgi:hypothetical protein